MSQFLFLDFQGCIPVCIGFLLYGFKGGGRQFSGSLFTVGAVSGPHIESMTVADGQVVGIAGSRCLSVFI